jgi:transposase
LEEIVFKWNHLILIGNKKEVIPMNSMQINEVKVIVDENTKCFSVGSFLTYQQIDGLLGISNLLRSKGLKVKGVDLADIVKVLVCGVLDGKKSVRAIVEDAKLTGKFDFVGSDLDTVLKTFYRALEAVGDDKAEGVYEELTQCFQEKFNIKVEQANLDYTSSYFEGDKAYLAAHGYSRDKRPDKKQLKLGIIQFNKEKFARAYFFDSGEKSDIKQFEDDFLKSKDSIPEGSLIVLDRGIASKKNLDLIQQHGFKYLVGLKRDKKSKEQIKYLKKNPNKMEKLDDNYQVFVEKDENVTRFYFYSKQLDETKKRKRKEQFEKKYEEALKQKSKTTVKRFVTGLENELIVTEIFKQKRLVNRSKDKLEESFLEINGEFDGWFTLETNDEKISAKEALQKYKDKDSVEKVFCMLKQNCKLRPFNVRNKKSVKGSLFISMLSSLVVGVFAFKHDTHLKGKSPTTIIDLVKHLTVDLVYNQTGQTIKQIFKNVNTLLKNLFPQLAT